MYVYCLVSYKDIVIVENEYNVFFQCDQFGTERQSALYSWYNGRDDLRSFYNLLKSENIIVIKKIDKFISVLMKLTDNAN